MLTYTFLAAGNGGNGENGIGGAAGSIASYNKKGTNQTYIDSILSKYKMYFLDVYPELSLQGRVQEGMQRMHIVTQMPPLRALLKQLAELVVAF